MWQGSTASAPSGVTLPDSAGRNSFRNSLAHRLATVVARSVSAFLPGRVSVGPPSFGKFGSEPCHTLS